MAFRFFFLLFFTGENIFGFKIEKRKKSDCEEVTRFMQVILVTYWRAVEKIIIIYTRYKYLYIYFYKILTLYIFRLKKKKIFVVGVSGFWSICTNLMFFTKFLLPVAKVSFSFFIFILKFLFKNFNLKNSFFHIWLNHII